MEKGTQLKLINYKAIFIMSLLSAILQACNFESPNEEQYFGYKLPIDSTIKIEEIYQNVSTYQTDMASIENIKFIAQDNFTNPKIYQLDGIGAIDTNTNKIVWLTAYPDKLIRSDYDKNQYSYIQSERVIVSNNRVLCTYKHTVPPNKIENGSNEIANGTFYNYLILDAKTGQIIKHDGMSDVCQTIDFIYVGDNWFVRNYKTKQVSRLDIETGEIIWTNSNFMQLSTVNENIIAMYFDNLDGTWQIEILDLKTGKPINEMLLKNLKNHTIYKVWYSKNNVFIELGAAYEINPLSAIGVKYKRYYVAFDAKDRVAIWRTPFVKY
ncbi:MAG: hypothetical protein KA174_00300 [Chitinophagales bacterium]|jgi:hypothetical protein|nr:hypothetical protein [Chitinophagales bacterium]